MAVLDDPAVLDNPLLAPPEQEQFPVPSQQQQMVQDFPLLQPPPEAPEVAVVPQAPVQSQAEVSPRDQYVAMQLRLADMIRQRGEHEVGVPPGERQPDQEEQALRQQISTAGRELEPAPQQRQPVPFQRPLTYTQTAESNLRAAEEQKNRAVRNALSQIRVTNIAEANKALAYYKQEQAGNRWRTIYGSQIAAGIDPATASANAWREVSPLVFQSHPASLGAVTRAATPPPGNPRIMQIPGSVPGAIALIDAQGRPHFPPASLLQTLTPGTPIEAKSADGTLLGHYFQLQNNRWHFEPIKKVDTSKMPKIDALRWQDAANEIKAAQADARQQIQTQPGEESPQDRIKKARAVQKELTEKYGVGSTPSVKPTPQPTETPGPAPANAPSGILPTILTKQEFDALDSGTVYIGKDGKKYRKP